MAGRAGFSPVMVGRKGELDRLTCLFHRLADPAVALVAGEAGIGKSRLVRELLLRLPPETPVVTAQAEEHSAGRPYGVLVDALEPYVSSWRALPEALAAHRAGLPALLAPVAPGLADTAVGPGDAGDLRRAVTRLVRHVVAPGPAVVVFEDLQWTDAETLDVLAALAVVPGLPVLLVGTHRLGPGEAPLANFLARLERRCQVEHCRLRALTPGEVAEMLAAVYRAPVPLRAVEAVHERSGGNPFFIEELLVATGGAAPHELAEAPLPATVTEAVLGHFDPLPELDRRVAGAAAILGRRIPFDLLAAVTGLGEDDLLVVLHRLVAGGLMLEEQPDVFSFRHALTREAVAGRLLARERRRLHEKAVVALQESGSDDWAELARHAAAAGRLEEEVVAARAGAVSSLRAGATTAALRLAELGLGVVGEDGELRELAATAAAAAGMPEAAVEHARRWDALAEKAGDGRRRVRALVLLARLQWETGDWAGQQATVAKAVAVAEDIGPSPELVLAYATAADACRLRHDPDGTLDWARRGLAAAERIGAAELRPSLLVSEAAATACSVEGAEAAAGLLERAIAEAELFADSTTALRGLRTLLVAMGRAWSAERNRAALDRMHQLADRWGRQDWRGEIARLEAALAAEHQGDLASARQVLAALDYDEALADTARARNTTFMAAQLALEAADPDAAGYVARARRQLEARRDPHQQVWAEALAVDAAARSGDTGVAVTHLRSLRSLLTRPETPFLWEFWCDSWCQALVSSLRAGVEPALIRHLHTDPPLPPFVGHVHNDPGWPDHLDAALAEVEGDYEAAVDAYRRALSSGGRRRWVPQAADVHQGLGRCLLALGRPEEARVHAEEACSLLEHWPGWRRTEARALLRRLGGGPVPCGPDSLSAREREVAALLAEGLSNAELARRLYISPKTAAVHVSHILTKLGMTTRAEVAAWAVRAGLAR